MNATAAYRQAARRVAEGKEIYSCTAIDGVVGWRFMDRSPLRDAYNALFRPMNHCELSWGARWGSTEGEGKRCRVLALLFMAAIAETEGL